MNDIKSASFFRGGNALFTVKNNKGQHFTFKVRQPKSEAGQPAKPYFVNLVGGTGTNGDRLYMGILTDNNRVALTKASKVGAQDLSVKVVEWAIGAVVYGKAIPAGYAIQHEGRCCCCGKTLTQPASISSGVGPECAKRTGLK